MNGLSRRWWPLLVTFGVGTIACGVLAVAIWQGWLGPDVNRGATFCEASRDGVVKQPANTVSNFGFVLAGLLIGWHVARRGTRADEFGDGVATSYAALVVLLGPGSAAMHATESACGGHLDMLSMYLIASFAAAWCIARLLRRRGSWRPLFVGLVGACEIVGASGLAVPVVMFAGNAAFAALLLVTVVVEAWLSRRDRRPIRWGVAALVVLLVAFGVWIMDQRGWCDPHSLLQGHAVWHLLNAAAAYCLFRQFATPPRRA